MSDLLGRDLQFALISGADIDLGIYGTLAFSIVGSVEVYVSPPLMCPHIVQVHKKDSFLRPHRHAGDLRGLIFAFNLFVEYNRELY